ncbi:MAG: hypothetical protein ACREO5_05085 [Candidatus Binatia bacterium]
MTVNKIFFGFMVLVGLATGAILVAVPALRNFAVPPYFWMLIAVVLFESGNTFIPRKTPVVMLNNPVRLVGLMTGIAVMVAVTMIAGVKVRYV